MIISENINDEKYIATFVHTKWLVLSSFFFIIPASYAYIFNLYSYSILLFLTSFISANYWRKATYSWRRNMDLVFSKLSFVIFFSDGVVYVNSVNYVITGYIGIILLLYCYYLSGKLFKLKNNNWYKYHMIFHLIIAYEQIIILDSIVYNILNV